MIHQRRLLVTVAVLVATGLTTACNGADPVDSGPAVEATAPDDGGSAAGEAPEECATAFPQAFIEPDYGEITLAPVGFPEPPLGATLCLTGETVGGRNETASYATTVGAEKVLAAYETALAAYSPSRTKDGAGRPILTASAEGVEIQVTPQEGGFVVAFAAG